MYERKYENIEPIDDPIVVLDLLYTDRYEWKLERCLLAFPHQDPYVRLEKPSGNGFYCYSITPRVVRELKSLWAVSGKPQWGYTDECHLTITNYGRDLMVEAWEKTGIKKSGWASDGTDWRERLRSWRWFQEWKSNES